MKIELVGKAMLSEKRELVTKQTGEVWRRIMKFAYIGGALEFVVPKDFNWDQFKESLTYMVKGEIQQERNGQVFMLTSVESAK